MHFTLLAIYSLHEWTQKHCTHMHAHTHTCTRTHTSTHTHTRARTHTRTHTQTHTRACVHTCANSVHACAHTYACMYTCKHTHTYTYISPPRRKLVFTGSLQTQQKPTLTSLTSLAEVSELLPLLLVRHILKQFLEVRVNMHTWWTIAPASNSINYAK